MVVENLLKQLRAEVKYVPLEGNYLLVNQKDLERFLADNISIPIKPPVKPASGGMTETEIRIDENKYWLEYINRFADHVPNTYRKANKHNFLDRIKELEDASRLSV